MKIVINLFGYGIIGGFYIVGFIGFNFVRFIGFNFIRFIGFNFIRDNIVVFFSGIFGRLIWVFIGGCIGDVRIFFCKFFFNYIFSFYVNIVFRSYFLCWCRVGCFCNLYIFVVNGYVLIFV